MFGVGGRDCRKISRTAFPYLCSDGSRTVCLLRTDIDLVAFVCFYVLGSMFVRIRQTVREQPDTGYRKSRPAYFAAIPGFGGGLFFEFFVWCCVFVCG